MTNKINFSKLAFLFLSCSILLFSSCTTTKKLKESQEATRTMQSSFDNCNETKDKISADLAALQKQLTKIKQVSEVENMELDALKKFLKQEEAKIQKLRTELKAAFSDYDKEAIRIEERDGRLVVIMQNKILYQAGKADVDLGGKEAIEIISQVFKVNKGLNILVESHTDDTPISNSKYKDNWDLSVARSVTVVRMLEKYGVNPTRLTAAGRGEFVPANKIAPINSEASASNRRTEFIITPKIKALYQLLNEL